MILLKKSADERKEMTGSQKALKVICIVLIVISILAILAGFVEFAGGMAIAGAGYAGAAADQEYYALGAGLLFILAVISIISGVVDLIIGILGVRGANNPEKIGPFFVIAIIGLVLCALGVIFTLSSGVTDLSALSNSLVQLVLLICCVVLAKNIRKLRQ